MIIFSNCLRMHLWDCCKPWTARLLPSACWGSRAGPKRCSNLWRYLITCADILVDPMKCLVQSEVLLLLRRRMRSRCLFPPVRSTRSHCTFCCASLLSLWPLCLCEVYPFLGIDLSSFLESFAEIRLCLKKKIKKRKLRSWGLNELSCPYMIENRSRNTTLPGHLQTTETVLVCLHIPTSIKMDQKDHT